MDTENTWNADNTVNDVEKRATTTSYYVRFLSHFPLFFPHLSHPESKGFSRNFRHLEKLIPKKSRHRHAQFALLQRRHLKGRAELL